MEAMAEAEEAARQVVQARATAQQTLHELSDLREQYALDIDVPREPKPNPGEERFSGLLGSVLREVGLSQIIDRGLDAELQSARRQADQRAGSPAGS